MVISRDICPNCNRLVWTLARSLYEEPPPGIETCAGVASSSCNFETRRRQRRLLQAYKRSHFWHQKAMLSYRAGATPGARTLNGISSAAAAIHELEKKP